MKNFIKEQVRLSYETKQNIYENSEFLDIVTTVAQKCVNVYKNSKKILIAGNGGSAADAQHFAAELVGRYGFDRPSLPSLALTTDTSNITAIGNDYGYEFIFSRQIESMANSGDLFIGISTSGNSQNVINAFEAASNKGVTTVALTGRDGGKMSDLADYAIVIPSNSTPRIQESHLLIEHIICDIIEQEMFGSGIAK
ncbi:MAG: D-sedoheptulose 7-phosphate isomerase [Campylobacterota bacterium]|nr:D-sedoheptulose 7-phosphate isomerase [Campylobacterota bacterium]